MKHRTRLKRRMARRSEFLLLKDGIRRLNECAYSAQQASAGLRNMAIAIDSMRVSASRLTATKDS